MLGEEAFDGVAAEPGAAPGREQWAGRGAAAFGEPVAQDGRGGGGERVARSLRPLPWQVRCGPALTAASLTVRPVSSETRRPWTPAVRRA